jgi:hypothetical protein
VSRRAALPPPPEGLVLDGREHVGSLCGDGTAERTVRLRR